MTGPHNMHSAARVPLVIVEEHHEAFCVWHHAIWRSWLARRGNALLHVDEHSDLRLPRLRRLPDQFSGPADVARFAYEDLGIGTFIWPAVFQRIFDRMIWLRPMILNREPARLATTWLQQRGRDVELVLGWYTGDETPPVPAQARCVRIV